MNKVHSLQWDRNILGENVYVCRWLTITTPTLQKQDRNKQGREWKHTTTSHLWRGCFESLLQTNIPTARWYRWAAGMTLRRYYSVPGFVHTQHWEPRPIDEFLISSEQEISFSWTESFTWHSVNSLCAVICLLSAEQLLSGTTVRARLMEWCTDGCPFQRFNESLDLIHGDYRALGYFAKLSLYKLHNLVKQVPASIWQV